VNALPTLLTLSRIPLAALVWLRPADPAWVLGLMLAAGITDVLDGWLARRLRRRQGREGERDIGAWLDPLTDKVFVVSALAAVGWALRPPLWIFPLIAARELAQIPLVLFLRSRRLVRRFDFRANVIGKLATVLQFAVVAALLLRHPARDALAVAAGAVGLAAAAYYGLRAVRTSESP
jgi:phosphatidylglycerophosphate synthase